MSLRNRTLFITGASRGIGLAIALRAARDGANVIVAAKTAEPHPKLPGTIHTAARAIEEAGGRALPLVVDVRAEGEVAAAVEKAVATFGGIDILVNNASAISLTGTLQTPVRIYDRMMTVNTRGTFVCSQACLPHLKRAENPHILNLSPPLNMDPRWFAPHVAYTMAKYGMSLCVLGMAHEFAADGIAVNALWPRTAIATAAIEFAIGNEALLKFCRKPEIVADAAHAILSGRSRDRTGQFLIDDEVLAATGVTDFDRYQVEPGAPLALDFFLDDQGPYIKRVVKLPGSDYG
ncbi:MAG TPA: NAD(P)-dependent oxidoreductase [Steroidobacteraceae bacterium]|nr:NAD(P)-dependent oxidoreductase [Steroidobacteraceae bacterium]